MKTGNKDTVTAWFAALCFFLSTIEYLIPKPLPFLRLGLANLPVMLAIGILPFRQFCALILIKILGQGLIGGTLFSYVFAFSAVGTVSSALVMLALKKAFPRGASFVGISVAGAFASNASQLALARWFIFGESAWYVAPPFCAVGVITGAILGLFANRYAA
ncbi:MAG TPA: Gx transporter family protein, partial [Treponemataceae bacterium]|nr:Gx transporter family protein [Treponemataceae bacterium]